MKSKTKFRDHPGMTQEQVSACESQVQECIVSLMSEGASDPIEIEDPVETSHPFDKYVTLGGVRVWHVSWSESAVVTKRLVDKA